MILGTKSIGSRLRANGHAPFPLVHPGPFPYQDGFRWPARGRAAAERDTVLASEQCPTDILRLHVANPHPTHVNMIQSAYSEQRPQIGRCGLKQDSRPLTCRPSAAVSWRSSFPSSSGESEPSMAYSAGDGRHRT